MLFKKSSKEFKPGPCEVDASSLIEHGILEILENPSLEDADLPWERLGRMTLRHVAVNSGGLKYVNTLLAYFSGPLACNKGWKPRSYVPYPLFEEPGNAYSVGVGHGGLRLENPYEAITVLLPRQLSADVFSLIEQFGAGLPDA